MKLELYIKIAIILCSTVAPLQRMGGREELEEDERVE
jgi:hypothetical protein